MSKAEKTKEPAAIGKKAASVSKEARKLPAKAAASVAPKKIARSNKVVPKVEIKSKPVAAVATYKGKDSEVVLKGAAAEAVLTGDHPEWTAIGAIEVAGVSEAPAPEKKAKASATAKLPQRPASTDHIKMDRIQSIVKAAVRAESAGSVPDVKERLPASTAEIPKVQEASYLDPVSTRKPVAKAKSTATAAPGKVSFSDLMQTAQSQTPVQVPIFDASKYAKK